jgi:hypothetical protein
MDESLEARIGSPCPRNTLVVWPMTLSIEV